MDFRKLFQLGKKIPTQEEAEILQDLMKIGGRSVDDEVRAARQAALQDTFDSAPKSAMESADSFAQKYDPNFTMGPAASELPVPTVGTKVGEAKYIPNFDTVGGVQDKTYRPNFTMAGAASEMPVPTPGTKMALGKSDIIDAEFRHLPVDVNAVAAGKGINPYLLGGTVAAGGMGALAYSMPDEENKPAMAVKPPVEEPRKIASAPEKPAEEESPLKKLESLLKPRSNAPRVMDFGNIQSANTVDGLKQVQDSANQAALVNNLGRAADLIGAGIARAKPSGQEVFSQQAKDSDKVIQQFKDRGEQEKNDPNSGVSQAYRKIMERFGVKVAGNPSAATLEKVAPWIAKAYEGEENRQARKENLALALEGKKEAKEQVKKDKIEKFTSDFRKEITGGGFKTQYANFQNGQRALNYIQDAIKNPNGFKDYGALMSALKSLQGDDSVVREAEINMGAKVGSVIDKIGSTLKQAATGQKLTDNQRMQMYQSVKILADISRNQYQRAIAPVMKQADDMGIPHDKLVNVSDLYGTEQPKKQSPEMQKAVAPGQKEIVKKGYNPKTNQTQFIYSDGSKEVKDGRL